MMPSTYLSHGVMCSLKVGNTVISKSTINIPAITGPNVETIGTTCLFIDFIIITKMYIFWCTIK